MKLKIRTMLPFFACAWTLSNFILIPILIAPVFGVLGVFFLYVPVIPRQFTILWLYQVRPKEVAEVLSIYGFIAWIIVESIVGSMIASSWFQLQSKKAVRFYMTTLILAAILTIIFAILGRSL